MEWLIGAVLLLLLCLRQTLLVSYSVALLLFYAVYENGHAEYLVYDVWEALSRDSLLVLPVFVLASALMSSGASVRRLTDFFRALGQLWPMAIPATSLLTVVIASALCGSPGIALLGFGPALYRTLLDDGYTAQFSIGLLCAGSVVGVMLPLSTHLIIYSAISHTELHGLFAESFVFAACMAGLLIAYVAIANWNLRLTPDSARPDSAHKGEAVEWMAAGRRAAPAIAPVAILMLAFMSGYFSLVQCGLLFLLSAVVMELGVYRELSASALTQAGLTACQQLGRLLPLVALGISFSLFLLYEQTPERVAEWLRLRHFESVHFLAVVNLGLLFFGLFTDAASALFVVTPILSPLAEEFAIGPQSFGVMLVFNLAVGYLTPPNGLVLIAAMIAFRENFSTVLAAVAPFLAVLLLGVSLSVFAALV